MWAHLRREGGGVGLVVHSGPGMCCSLRSSEQLLGPSCTRAHTETPQGRHGMAILGDNLTSALRPLPLWCSPTPSLAVSGGDHCLEIPWRALARDQTAESGGISQEGATHWRQQLHWRQEPRWRQHTHRREQQTSPWRAFLSCHGGHAESPQAPPTAVGTVPLCGWAGLGGHQGQHMALLWHTLHHSYPPPHPHLLEAFGLAPLCSRGSDSLEFSLFCKSTIIYR